MIEMRDGYWVNLQNVKSVDICHANVLGEEKNKWIVVATISNYQDEQSDLFGTREEAKAFAKNIADQHKVGGVNEIIVTLVDDGWLDINYTKRNRPMERIRRITGSPN